MDIEFVGMADHVMGSIYDRLTSGSETLSDFGSREGSHHPSHECFMAHTPNGHVKDVKDGDETPPDDEVERNMGASPRLQEEQQRARQ